MPSPNQRQAIDVSGLAAEIEIAGILSQLDGALASANVTHQQLGFLPNADDFAFVDLAVRRWAAQHGATITEDAFTSEADGQRIEVYRVAVGSVAVVTVHRPRELHAQPKPAPAPRVVVDADARWSPASGQEMP